ncbi:MAG: isochorismatase family cysteine hydrolase [Candidatus Marinimicrobia bacterium]|nr:isochorismatase family cysteine hydrolase [Candidatus Neomarinimicrobiota bacterium]
MKALLVVDIQERFIKGSHAYEEDRFIRTVNKAIDSFRKAGDFIVYVHHIKGDVVPGTPGWEFDQRVHKDNNAPNVWKTKGNAFDGTNLREILDEKNVTEITVCGLVTQNCIRSTCIGCIEEEYKTYLVKNGTTNWTDDPRKTIDDVEAELKDLGVVTG